MKKLTTMIVTFVLCLAMSMTVLAAESPAVNNGSQSPSVNNGSQSPAANNGNQTGYTGQKPAVQKALSVNNVNEAQKAKLAEYFAAMENIDNDTTLSTAEKNAKKAEYVQKMINKVLGLKQSYIKGVYVAVDLKASDLSKALKIDVPGIKAGDGAVVAHLTSEGVWENVPVEKVEDGAVYAKFTSLSPVFVAAYEKTAVTEVSPKTADMNAAVLALVAVLAAGGAVVFAKRKCGFLK